MELCRHVVLELMARCAVQSIETFTSLGTFMASGLLPLHAFLHFRFNPAAPATVPLPLPLTLPLRVGGLALGALLLLLMLLMLMLLMLMLLLLRRRVGDQ